MEATYGALPHDLNATSPGPFATATFGGGSFWTLQYELNKLPGISGTAVGYMGGTTENPHYEDVCTDRTGHAEVVQVYFDPNQISYGRLLEAFFSLHDPTQLNRQGVDEGSQYRSVIFYHSEEQRQQAQAAMQQQRLCWPGPIVTQLAPADTFWLAEDYHQRYFEKRGAGRKAG